MSWLAVTGHTNLDIILHLQQLPAAGESRPVRQRETKWGGTGCNIARHAAGLGVPTRLWSRVGTDMPAEWIEALTADGVDLAFLDRDPDRPTPTCFILTDPEHHQSYCMDQGAMGAADQHPPDPGFVAGCTWLHVGTGKPAAYRDLVDHARQAGVRVGFDPGQEIHYEYDTSMFESMLDRSDLFFCNEVELQRAFDLMSYGDPVQFLDHTDAVIVTRSGKGASLYRSGDRPKHFDAAPLPGPMVDPTGAGDAFRAGYYAGLHAGLGQEAAMEWALTAGAFACTFDGPQAQVLTRHAMPA